MESLFIPVEQFQLYLIVLSRVAGFFSAIPVFSSGQNPAQIKVGLSVMIALILFPVMAPSIPVVEFGSVTFLLFMVSEVLLGSLLGLISRMIFTAIEFGATVIGYQMGFAAANVFDPQSERQLSLISQFQNVFAIMIFLAIDGHHIFIQTAAISYEYLPPGQFNVSGNAIPYLFELSAHMFQIGFQFSAPVLSVLLLSGLSLGILARIFPQLNVFMLSFPLNIGISFVVIALTLSFSAMLITREFGELTDRILTMLSYLAH